MFRLASYTFVTRQRPCVACIGMEGRSHRNKVGALSFGCAQQCLLDVRKMTNSPVIFFKKKQGLLAKHRFTSLNSIHSGVVFFLFSRAIVQPVSTWKVVLVTLRHICSTNWLFFSVFFPPARRPPSSPNNLIKGCWTCGMMTPFCKHLVLSGGSGSLCI